MSSVALETTNNIKSLIRKWNRDIFVNIQYFVSEVITFTSKEWKSEEANFYTCISFSMNDWGSLQP